MVGAEERGRALVQTEMADKFIALQFPFSSKLKIWSFHVVVVQGLQRNVKISVMHVQRVVVLLINLLIFNVLLAVVVVVS